MPPWTCLELPQCLKLIQETVDRRKHDENRLYIFILDFVNHQFSNGGFLFCICLKLVGKHVQLSALCMESPHGESESDMVRGTSGVFCPHQIMAMRWCQWLLRLTSSSYIVLHRNWIQEFSSTVGLGLSRFSSASSTGSWCLSTQWGTSEAHQLRVTVSDWWKWKPSSSSSFCAGFHWAVQLDSYHGLSF